MTAIIPTSSSPIILPEDGETFGFDPERNGRLIAKFRAMDPALRATIIPTEQEPKA